jgi:hypothetical protein
LPSATAPPGQSAAAPSTANPWTERSLASTPRALTVSEITDVRSRGGLIYGIAAGQAGIWAISENSNRAWKIDADVPRIDAMIALEHPPRDLSVGARAVWLANADGTLSRIDSRTAGLVKTVSLGRYPRTAYPVDLVTGQGLVWVALH